MSAIDAISAVTARLQGVPGIGPHVYNMVRAARSDAEFQQTFVDAATNPLLPLVSAWQVTREATASRDEALQAMSRTHTISITGFMSFQDNLSEPVFQALVEAICAAFDPYAVRHFDTPIDWTGPNGVANIFSGRFDWSGPMQVVSVKLGMLGNVLVHAALLTIQVREFPL